MRSGDLDPECGSGPLRAPSRHWRRRAAPLQRLVQAWILMNSLASGLKFNLAKTRIREKSRCVPARCGFRRKSVPKRSLTRIWGTGYNRNSISHFISQHVAMIQKNLIHLPSPPPPPLARLAAFLLLAPLALAAAPPALARCELSDLVLEKVFPVGDLIEDDSAANNAIISVKWPGGDSGPDSCPARDRPLTACVNVWETTACPPEAPPGVCEGNIRGVSSVNFRPNAGWGWAQGRMICNQNFGQAYDRDSDGTDDSARNGLNLFLLISRDNVKADRQNHLIVVMYDPVRYLRIPIRDDD